MKFPASKNTNKNLQATDLHEDFWTRERTSDVLNKLFSVVVHSWKTPKKMSRNLFFGFVTRWGYAKKNNNNNKNIQGTVSWEFHAFRFTSNACWPLTKKKKKASYEQYKRERDLEAFMLDALRGWIITIFASFNTSIVDLNNFDVRFFFQGDVEDGNTWVADLGLGASEETDREPTASPVFRRSQGQPAGSSDEVGEIQLLKDATFAVEGEDPRVARVGDQKTAVRVEADAGRFDEVAASSRAEDLGDVRGIAFKVVDDDQKISEVVDDVDCSSTCRGKIITKKIKQNNQLETVRQPSTARKGDAKVLVLTSYCEKITAFSLKVELLATSKTPFWTGTTFWTSLDCRWIIDYRGEDRKGLAIWGATLVSLERSWLKFNKGTVEPGNAHIKILYRFYVWVWDCQISNHVVEDQLFTSLCNRYHQDLSDIEHIQIRAFFIFLCQD